MRPKLAVLLAVAAAASVAHAAARERTLAGAGPTPQKGATAFYDTYVQLHPSGMPDRSVRTHMMQFISARLYTLFMEGDRAEVRYAQATKHEVPPLVEGDLFTSLFEGASSYAMGVCRNTSATAATCTVNLTYTSDGQPDTKWTDTALMVLEGGKYRVDDIVYGGTWAFGNKGKLSDAVNAAIAESRMPVK